MRVVIVENEPMAAQRLEQTLLRCASDAAVVARLESVRETIDYLKNGDMPDLMFLDIHLGDGLAWEIFEACKIECPVIFTTAYDDYMAEAYSRNGIEYLMKPVEAARLAQALEKYWGLRAHFARYKAEDLRVVAEAVANRQARWRRRFLVRGQGTEFVSIPTEDAAYFFTEHKITFLVATDGKRYCLDEPLSDVESQLDPKEFFRANRQYLVSFQTVLRIRPTGRRQIELEVRDRSASTITISQDRVSDFRRWLDR